MTHGQFPLEPPAEDYLATTYRIVCEMANDDGVVRGDVAICAVEDRFDMRYRKAFGTLRRLSKRGYMQLYATPEGEFVWNLTNGGGDAED